MIKSVSYFCAIFERKFHVDDKSEPIVEKREVYLPTKTLEIDRSTDMIDHFQKDIVNYITKKAEDVMIEGSGFALSEIKHLHVQVFKYEPLNASGYIELPKILKKKMRNKKFRKTQKTTSVSSGRFWQHYIMKKLVKIRFLMDQNERIYTIQIVYKFLHDYIVEMNISMLL